MKKLFIAAVILIGTTVQSLAGPIVTVKLRIGKNKLDCADFGLCWKGSSVDVSAALVENGAEDGTVLQINDRTGNLDLIVPSSIWKEKSDFFSGVSVVFEEEVNFGPKISRLLGSSVPVVIKPGKYVMKKDHKNNAIITVPLIATATFK